MKIPLSRIDTIPRETRFAETVDIVREEASVAVRFPSPVQVDVTYYRSGREIFFHGRLKGEAEAECSRCLEDCGFVVEKSFDFVLTPDPLPTNKNMELTADEMGLSFYTGEDIDLSPFVREQTLLALPLRPLCSENCRGLCPDCGAELNRTTCGCTSPGDPRMAVFRNLRLDQS